MNAQQADADKVGNWRITIVNPDRFASGSKRTKTIRNKSFAAALFACGAGYASDYETLDALVQGEGFADVNEYVSNLQYFNGDGTEFITAFEIVNNELIPVQGFEDESATRGKENEAMNVDKVIDRLLAEAEDLTQPPHTRKQSRMMTPPKGARHLDASGKPDEGVYRGSTAAKVTAVNFDGKLLTIEVDAEDAGGPITWTVDTATGKITADSPMNHEAAYLVVTLLRAMGELDHETTSDIEVELG